MTKVKIASIISAVLISLPAISHAAAGTSGGLSLINDGSARAASLGQAYTASFDDIAGMAYNPASLATLQSGQASFLYQQGLIEDAQGHFMVGTPIGSKSALGLSFGYYNGGNIDLVDANNLEHSVSAQKDLTGALGFAHTFSGLSMGLNAKVLQSKLIDQYSATAYAVDFGVHMPISSRLHVGASALNYGTKLTYIEEGDKLPSSLNLGSSFLMLQGRAPTTLLANLQYLNNEKVTMPSLGVETIVGPLAIRAGYRTGGGNAEMTFGAGFALGRTNLDYAFGMMNSLDATHKVSMAMKFGGPRIENNFVRKPEIKKREVAQAPSKYEEKPVQQAAAVTTNEPRHTLGGGQQVLRAPVRRQQRRVYVVKPGDTLGSIARNELGDKRQWQAIYKANAHLIDDPSQLEKGMKIIIP